MELAGRKLSARHYIAFVAILGMFIAPLFGDNGSLAVVFLGYPATLIAGVLFLRKAKNWTDRLIIVGIVIATFCTANTIALITLN